MQEFHIGDVLTVTTGIMLSPTLMDGTYSILNYMTRDNLFTHQLPRACDECKPWLLRQYPTLGTPEFADEVDSLIRMIDAPSANAGTVVNGWLADICAKYGLPKTLPVERMPMDDHANIDPLTELESMVGKARIIVL